MRSSRKDVDLGRSCGLRLDLILDSSEKCAQLGTRPCDAGLDRVDGEVVYEGEPFFSLQQPTPVVRDPGHGGLDLGVQDCVFRMPSTSPRRLRPAMSIHPYQFLWVLLVSSLGIVIFDRDVGWAVLERGGLQRNGRYGAAWVRGHVLERQRQRQAERGAST